MSADPRPPSSEVAERYRTVVAGLLARVQALDETTWSAQTPCSEWTARDLVTHVVDVHRRVHSRLDASEPVPVDPADDLTAALRQATDAVAAALDDPVLAERVVESIGGTQPFERLVGSILCADTLLHTWDLARATGQDERLDPAAVDAALTFLTPMDAAIRRPGAFGPRIDAPPGADPQTRLINFCGRPT
jgi:uncharacterized protein (TIGR03086 family)